MKTNFYKLFSAIFLFAVAISCGKKVHRPDCGPIQEITITKNNPVVEGKSLILRLPVLGSDNLLYKWSGPRGYSFETSDSLAGQTQVFGNVTKAYAGVYKIQVLNKAEGCVQFEGSISVAISTSSTSPPTDTIPVPNPPTDTTTVPIPPTDTITIPTPPTNPNPGNPNTANPTLPCSITPNISTSTATVGAYTFKYISFNKSGNEYVIKASESQNGDYIEFKFKVNGQLTPGVYKTNGGNISSQPGLVGAHIKTLLLDYTAPANQFVYISKFDGKLQLSICSVKFGNLLDLLSKPVVSARIVEP